MGAAVTGFALAPDEARAMERSMAAFELAAHDALVADQRRVAAQTRAQALVYAVEETDRALVDAILTALERAGVDHVFRVFSVHDGAAWLWMNGNAKVRSSELRDEAIWVLEAGGFEVVRRGCWDVSVRRLER